MSLTNEGFLEGYIMFQQLEFDFESSDEVVLAAFKHYKALALDYARQVRELPLDAPRIQYEELSSVLGEAFGHYERAKAILDNRGIY